MFCYGFVVYIKSSHVGYYFNLKLALQFHALLIRLVLFQQVPDSTRFQIENRSRGSTLLKNQVPASGGSGAESFKSRFPCRASSPVKYLIQRTNSRFQSNTWFSLMSRRQNVTLDCSKLVKAPHTTDANRNVRALICIVCHWVIYKLVP